MPGMTIEYCKSTPISKMGFSQKSSCKALGVIPRTSGKKIVSDKYKRRSKNKKGSRERSSLRRSKSKKGSRERSSLRRSKSRRG